MTARRSAVIVALLLALGALGRPVAGWLDPRLAISELDPGLTDLVPCDEASRRGWPIALATLPPLHDPWSGRWGLAHGLDLTFLSQFTTHASEEQRRSWRLPARFDFVYHPGPNGVDEHGRGDDLRALPPAERGIALSLFVHGRAAAWTAAGSVAASWLLAGLVRVVARRRVPRGTSPAPGST